MIDISTFAFQELYKLLTKQISVDYLSKDQLKIYEHNEDDIWNLLYNASKKTIFEAAFGDRGVESKHLLDKMYKFDPELNQYGPIREDILIRAFEIVKIEFPANLVIRNSTPLKKARLMYQLFLMRDVPEVYEQNKAEITVYDIATNTIDYDALDQLPEKKVFDYKKRKYKMSKEEKSSSNTNKDVEEITKLVFKFYNNVCGANIEESWNSLSPLLQSKKWKDFDHFKSGYQNTESINNIHVWNIQFFNGVANCKVYYDDEVNAYTSSELGNLNSISVGEINKFIERIADLKTKADKLAINGFEDIELSKFFNDTVSEYIWWKCGLSDATINKLLPTPKKYTVPRVIHIFLVKEENQWLIKNFAGVASQVIT